jgi:hypothetical protein
MVKATNRDGVLVADFASERAMIRLGRGEAAHDTGLARDKFAVFLIAQTDSLTCQTVPCPADGFLRSLCEYVFVVWARGPIGKGGRDFDSLASEPSRGTATSETLGLGNVAHGLVPRSSSLEDAFSIAATSARKLISTRWASTVVG